MSTTLEKRSPLKSTPLRNPGQSLDEAIERLFEDDFVPYVLGTAALFVMAMMEWWYWYLQSPPQPIPLTLMLLVMALGTARKFVRVRRRIRQLKLARDGERAVGQYLEQLRERGYRVLHDLVGEGFNVDHVLIGPASVFTIEAKTIRKPARGKTEVEYDGEQITLNGLKPDRDPITQGKAQAHWRRGLLEDTTGRRIEVWAMVLYPGWFVKLLTAASRLDVLVLNPKSLPGFLEKSGIKLSLEEITLITYHLSRSIRTTT
ncbi:MAG: nuclease-related domain-containing protein [Candidatus Competibacteraceae bacterium]